MELVQPKTLSMKSMKGILSCFEYISKNTSLSICRRQYALEMFNISTQIQYDGFAKRMFQGITWVVPPPSNSGNEGLGWDSLLRME